MDQMRKITHVLNPADFAKGGLNAALTELAQTTRGYGVSCDFLCHDQENLLSPIDQQTGLTVYRICKEAITNAIKHGKPKRIQILLNVDTQPCILRIENDGLDFDHTSDNHGMGLAIMKDRAATIGGSLNIEIPPTGGTIISCTFGPIS